MRGIVFTVLLACSFASAQSDEKEFAMRCGAALYDKADVLLASEDGGKTWHPITESALKKCEECADVATFSTSGNASLLVVKSSAESGDFITTQSYCYDQHRRASSAQFYMRNAHGWAIARSYVRGPRGFVLARESSSDLQGHHIPRPDDWDNYADVYEHAPKYLKLEQVPFYGFLKPSGDKH